jgi:citrate synthase
MGILASLTSALTAFNPSSVDVGSEEEMYQAIVTILAKFPILVGWTQRKVKGLPLNYYDTKLSYVDNVAQMMFKKPNSEYTSNPIVIEALNKLLILHADHEQNCSTSTVRIVGSSHAGLFRVYFCRYFCIVGPTSRGCESGCY